MNKAESKTRHSSYPLRRSYIQLSNILIRCEVAIGHRDRLVKSEWPRRGQQVSGRHGEGETPVPIPNTAVKPFCADGTVTDGVTGE